MSAGTRPDTADESELLGAFVVSEAHGIWGTARQFPGLARLGGAGLLESLSCASAGNCSAGGDFDGGSCCNGFIVSEHNGAWERAHRVPGLAGLGSVTDGIDSVSRGSAGNCSAGGGYVTSSFPPGGPSYAFAVGEKNGTWGSAVTFPAQ